MRSTPPARFISVIWIACITCAGCLLSDLVPNLIPNAEARSYKKRERSTYECRPSQELPNADLDKARRLWESGMIYYDSKEYSKSRADLQVAYDISHVPDFLINLAQVCSKLEMYADAIKHLEAYIQECPGAPDVPIASQRIEELRVSLALKEGSKPPPTQRRLPPTASLFLVGAGAAMLIVGAGLGGAAIAAGKQVGNPANQNMIFSPDLQTAERRGMQMQGAAIALDVIGAVTLVTGGSWALSWLYEQKTGMSLSLAPRGAGFALQGSF